MNQESLYYWVDEKGKSVPHHNWGVTKNTPSAFTVAELGELLADGMTDSHRTGFGYWTCKYEYVSGDQEPTVETRGDTEAEARGLMLAYLLENKLITLTTKD